MPIPPAIPPSSSFSQETKHGLEFGKDTTVSLDYSLNTLNGVEQPAITGMDAKPEDGGFIERSIYAPPKPAWDQGYNV
jgi:hypothetical protein